MALKSVDFIQRYIFPGGCLPSVTAKDVTARINQAPVRLSGKFLGIGSPKMRVTAKAHTTIEDFNEYFDSRLSDDEFDTIGGLILNQLGRLPKRGEKVDVEGHHFSVLRV